MANSKQLELQRHWRRNGSCESSAKCCVKETNFQETKLRFRHKVPGNGKQSTDVEIAVVVVARRRNAGGLKVVFIALELIRYLNVFRIWN